MDRLSGLDASFLYLETQRQLMHVCGLIILDPSTIPGGYSYDRFHGLIAGRVGEIPEFTRRLRRVPLGLDHPVWVRDQRFDIDHHVHRMRLPDPGGYAELVELCGELASQPLDRGRPLWEMWVIEGYDDKVVAFTKMHHATVDGASGSNLIAHLCSLEPDEPPRSEAESPQGHGRAPAGAELLGRAVVSTLARPFTVPRLVRPSAALIGESLGRARRGIAMAAPLSAPRTRFNATITGHRSIGFTDVALSDVKQVRAATGATVNDIVLSVAGGALRRHLLERDELPAASLLATVPVSVRESSQRSNGANKVSALFARLHTDIEDPWARLRATAESNQHAKAHQRAMPADALHDWAEFATPGVLGMAVRAYAGLRLAEKHPVVHNLVISNVHGSPIPLFFMGARIEALYPLGPVFHGAGLNITVISNDGRVHIGVIACREFLADPDELVRHFPDELEALNAAVSSE